MSGSLPVFLAVALLVGALLFGIGAMLVHMDGSPKIEPSKSQPSKPESAKVVEQNEAQAEPAVEPVVIAQPMMAQPFVAETFNTQPAWTHAFVDSEDPIDVPARIEMIASLALIKESWSESILQIARAEEHDPDVRAAIAVALAAKTG